MAFAAERVVAAEPVVDIGCAVLEERVVILVVDPKEVLARNAFDDGVLHGRCSSLSRRA
jgi:hypothetical protein